MLDIPEIAPRITPKKILDDPSVGLAEQLRQKLRFLIVIGIFGRGATLHTICRRMYVTSTFDEPQRNKTTGEMELVEVINDVSAYDRIDNICRSANKPLIQAELDFLRQCFERVFGNNAMAAISDEMLLKGSMFQILSSLPGTLTEFNWSDIDPILALRGLPKPTTRNRGSRLNAARGDAGPNRMAVSNLSCLTVVRRSFRPGRDTVCIWMLR
ncbi:hypothetical protein TRP8649_03304 [Pelagimonas phthalicica]|uniref:Uncharacterized protein n=1 Tax=Pelagimonas phthalicica TaxID=1037362 RepID=A0A238JER2_9RHOB|nr:hypothetical protein [Pelagimonas phthalicica]TDS92121.1 hypothetical protein CLV87_3304 [Pelagimonas phthalicica]SMX29171.1 hypothetical protein TRP8649_03304 [Pelagimonas phthalicica]